MTTAPAGQVTTTLTLDDSEMVVRSSVSPNISPPSSPCSKSTTRASWPNLMRMNKETVCGNKQLLRQIGASEDLEFFRAQGVVWLLNMASVTWISVETRDSSVQIMDKFVVELGSSGGFSSARNDHLVIIGMAAAAALIVASKLHEVRPMCASLFPHFEKERLLEFERRMLLQIGFQIVPQATPSAFVRHMLDLWPTTKSVSDKEILMATDELVGLFWKDLDSLRYAPSTIALSALLLTFSRFKMDCTGWLHRLPDECFPPKPSTAIANALLAGSALSSSSTSFQGGHAPSLTGPDPLQRAAARDSETAIDPAFLDIDRCILNMQKVQLQAVNTGLLQSKKRKASDQQAGSAGGAKAGTAADGRSITPTGLADLLRAGTPVPVSDLSSEFRTVSRASSHDSGEPCSSTAGGAGTS